MISSILNNTTIKIKLYCVVLLPILGILFFSSENIYTKHLAKEDASYNEKINILNNKIAIFIDNLQKDRGIRGSFLNSDGAIVLLELEQHKEKTDKSASFIKTAISFKNRGN